MTSRDVMQFKPPQSISGCLSHQIENQNQAEQSSKLRMYTKTSSSTANLIGQFGFLAFHSWDKQPDIDCMWWVMGDAKMYTHTYVRTCAYIVCFLNVHMVHEWSESLSVK